MSQKYSIGFMIGVLVLTGCNNVSFQSAAPVEASTEVASSQASVTPALNITPAVVTQQPIITNKELSLSAPVVDTTAIDKEDVDSLPQPFIVTRIAGDRRMFYPGTYSNSVERINGVATTVSQINVNGYDHPEYKLAPIDFMAGVQAFDHSVPENCSPIKFILGDVVDFNSSDYKLPKSISYRAFIEIPFDYDESLRQKRFEIPADIVGFTNDKDRKKIQKGDLDFEGMTIYSGFGATGFSIVFEAEFSSIAYQSWLGSQSQFQRVTNSRAVEKKSELSTATYSRHYVQPPRGFNGPTGEMVYLDHLCDQFVSSESLLPKADLLVAFERNLLPELKNRIIYRGSGGFVLVRLNSK